MIAKQLKTANETLKELIAITESDLADIKAAKHEAVFSRAKAKEELAASFQAQKAALDQAIASAMKHNPNADLASVVSSEERDLLETLKGSLIALHKMNKRLAVMVLTIGEFYSSLVSAILPSEQHGYGGSKLASASILSARG
jgi:uncharacterized membrane protein YdbT with pleckstrin-like domain